MKQNNIPISLTNLVGRQKDVEDVCRLLSTSRLITLLGPGGVGKTRLAIEVARNTVNKYRDGGCWVDLASLIDPALIPQTIAKSLDLYVPPDQSPLNTIENYLQVKQLLLVLDNCEHLVLPCAEVVEKLLTICPNLQILTTSREGLGILGEVTWRVPSLAFPDTLSLTTVSSLQDYPSIRLFLERAAAVSPGYSLSESNSQAIALICQKLDGIPLAIELAAARVKLLSAGEIAMRLDDRFNLLTGGGRNALPRQQTLRASLDWSYELLTEPEQRLFRCLSVFADCFNLEAAEQVFHPNFSNTELTNFLDLLESLVNKSLITAEIELKGSESETRYQMQETIREYAREKLADAGEIAVVHTAYLNYYLGFLKHGEPKLYDQELSSWSDQLELEYDNLRAAIEWSLGKNDIELASHLVLYLGRFWQFRGYYGEAAMWLDRILAVQGAADQPRAMLLLERGNVAQAQGEYEQAAAFVEASLAIFIALEDSAGIAQAKMTKGIIRVFQGEREQGIELLEESQKTFQESGDEWHTASALLYISDTYNRMGNEKKAVPLCQECLALFTKLGDPWGIAFASGNAGEIARKQGDFQQAKEYFRKTLVFHWEHDMKGEVSYPLETLALIAISENKFDRGVCLWGAAEAFRERANAPLPPAYKIDYQIYLTQAHEKLGEQAYIEALQQGRSLKPTDVIDLATQDDIVLPQITSTSGEEYGAEVHLTRRETEILRLVATGLTDAQVADQLYLSPRTVGKHMESIYRKFNVNSRTAAVHIAKSQKIIE